LSDEGAGPRWATLGRSIGGEVIVPDAAGLEGLPRPFNDRFRDVVPRAVVRCSGRVPGEERELDLMPWGGAYNRVRPDATAFVHRSERFQIKHAAVVDPAAPATNAEAARAWVERSWASVHPWGSGRVFQNFVDLDLEDWATAYYGDNLERLTRIKVRYDPDDVFRSAQPPTSERSRPTGS
jgi:hypothetical protein